ALLRIGWKIKRQAGTSHRVLSRNGWPDFVFAFHDGQEIGPKMLPALLNEPASLLSISADDNILKHALKAEPGA
ncbi:MAG: hypothetical protein QG657_2113, partial [Acidobacteriota bacterium]|nr:hypothetical protein [Acidobacteriota bacterium]